MSDRPEFTVEYLEPPVGIEAEPLPEDFSSSRLRRSLLILGAIVLVVVAAIMLVPGLGSLRERFDGRAARLARVRGGAAARVLRVVRAGLPRRVLPAHELGDEHARSGCRSSRRTPCCRSAARAGSRWARGSCAAAGWRGLHRAPDDRVLPDHERDQRGLPRGRRRRAGDRALERRAALVARRDPCGVRAARDPGGARLHRIVRRVSRAPRWSRRASTRRCGCCGPLDPLILFGAAGYMLFDVAMLGVCFTAFGNDFPPVGVLLVAYIIGQLGSLIPIPGGIGGVDGGLIGTLVIYGVDAGDAAVAVIAYRGLLLAIPALLGLPALAVLRRRLTSEAHDIAMCAPGQSVEVLGRGLVERPAPVGGLGGRHLLRLVGRERQ